MGEIVDRDENQILVYGNAYPVNIDGSHDQNRINDFGAFVSGKANLQVKNYSLKSVTANNYGGNGPTFHHFIGKTYGQNAFGGNVPIYVYGEPEMITQEQDKITQLEMKLSLLRIERDKQSLITWILVKGKTGGDFYISATEITFDQYDKFCEATGYDKLSADFGRGKQPVINVNVADAVAFCNWLSKETGTTVRLPEENEWEYAVRGGENSK